MADAFKYRGVMLDLARLMERKEYYLGLLPWLARWGYNLLHLHFTDDQGCALRFPSHPELATPHAFSPDEMRAFCAEAERHGIEVVPEIECFGHTDFITRHPKYAHLREAAEGPQTFSGMCVFEPEAQAVLRDLLRDTAEIFRPRLIHAGLDEVNFGAHPTSKRLLESRSKEDLFADHVNWCHDEIASLGARMAMWGDHLLPDHDPGAVIASRTPRDTLIFDWHYEREFVPESLDFFIGRGFEVYGAPAIQHSRCRVITGPENFENCRRFAGYALQRRKESRGKGSVTGMVVTVWCPYRYVPGSIEFPLAVCGKLFSDEDSGTGAVAEDFAGEFFGLRRREVNDVAPAIQRLYHIAPNRNEYDRIVFGANLWRPAESFSVFDKWLSSERIGGAVLSLFAFVKALPRVKQNADRLRDLIVAGEFLRTIYLFGVNGRAGNPGWGNLRRAMQAAWKRSRYPDGPDYTRKSDRVPRKRGDYDAIMRHLNRLA